MTQLLPWIVGLGIPIIGIVVFVGLSELHRQAYRTNNLLERIWDKLPKQPNDDL